MLQKESRGTKSKPITRVDSCVPNTQLSLLSRNERQRSNLIMNEAILNAPDRSADTKDIKYVAVLSGLGIIS